MEQKILDEIYELIGQNFGHSIIEQYKEFYKGKPDEIIFISIESLLTELVGPEVAKEQLISIKESLNISSN